jgi:hypothetical protein
MNVPKKVTDFIRLDAGNIGRKSAVVTGAALAASVLGTVLMSQTAEAYEHCDCQAHSNYWYTTCNGACNLHHNAYDGPHTNGPC